MSSSSAIHNAIEALPDELLLEIIDQVHSETFKGVLALSLVNRRFHSLTRNLIYTTFSLNKGDPALFIRTLASFPELARCVKVVDWDCSKIRNTLVTSDVFEFPEDLTQVERRNIMDISTLNDYADIASLNEQLSSLGSDFCLSFLLSFTPKVHTLNVTIPSKWNYHAIWFRQAPTSQILNNLHTATVTGPMRIQNVVPLFSLPSLRSLTLDLVRISRDRILAGVPYEWHNNNEAFERLQREGSRVEDFHLPNCSTDTADIARLLKLFHGLKQFEFGLTDHSQGEINSHTSIQALLHAMTHQKNSLTSLSFQDARTARNPEVLKDLSQLEHLNFLSLDLTIMCEFYLQKATVASLSKVLQQLPKSLTCLHLIANCPNEEDLKPSARFVNALHGIAPFIKTILPDLQILRLVDWSPLEGTFTCQTRVKAMQLGFAEVGVEFLPQPLEFSVWKQATDDDDLLVLEDEEEGWIWVQWVDRHGSWLTGRGGDWTKR
ncbi:hypothetical protein DDE82_005440 [Stemphylium lycopersici]|uniref:F-box domain-containing protein n=1 Tax=Stemphylium lycopersici TaxID=183478 RepID=A0A364N741_STELY|nr:hypothetical protein TW65_05140 [Stemphylium lycopersici]RAR03074.1 hypothetical protein DDE82_005440 [Stemphylium lycopersici]RAR13086.1 hypothetical protein DDE83_003612 [Stemphylium lycopersici]